MHIFLFKSNIWYCFLRKTVFFFLRWINKDKLRVEIAADNLAGNGNPFSDYSIFDFDLSNCRLTKEEGCTVTSSKENKIEFEPYQNDFEIVIEGLYPKWAYIQKTIFINHFIEVN